MKFTKGGLGTKAIPNAQRVYAVMTSKGFSYEGPPKYENYTHQRLFAKNRVSGLSVTAHSNRVGAELAHGFKGPPRNFAKK